MIKFMKFLCMTGIIVFLMGCGSKEDKTQIESEEGIRSIIQTEISDVEFIVLEPVENGIKMENTLSENSSEEMEKLDWVWLEEDDDETGFIMEGKLLLEFYYPGEGRLFLKLYYDEETGTGSGVSYGYGADNNKVGFYFDDTEEGDFAFEAPYDFSRWVYSGSDVRNIKIPEDLDAITNYHEQIEYYEDGKPLYFRAAGDYARYEWETDFPIIEIDYSYREDGSLAEKWCRFDPYLFGTYESSRYIYYDEAGRVVYTEEYVTHGSLQRYYIYEGDNDVPAYCFVFDSGWDAFMVKYK